jgi:type IV/VI secretion system ImpK/VasF family protein
MTLLELCEPLFLYVCRVSRSARKGGHFEVTQVHTEIKARLQEMRSAAASDPRLAGQFEEIERPLVYFVDSIILSSNSPLASQWEPLQVELWNERAGDDLFFDRLEETLRERGEAATERLAVYYTCLGLGFTGRWAGQPEHLRRLSNQISGRIRQMMEVDDNALICPQAYENVNTSDFIQPPARSVLGITIALVAMIVALFVGNLYLYHQRSQELSRSLDAIIKQSATTVPAGTTPPP